jgi:hypothetical protein
MKQRSVAVHCAEHNVLPSQSVGQMTFCLGDSGHPQATQVHCSTLLLLTVHPGGDKGDVSASWQQNVIYGKATLASLLPSEPHRDPHVICASGHSPHIHQKRLVLNPQWPPLQIVTQGLQWVKDKRRVMTHLFSKAKGLGFEPSVTITAVWSWAVHVTSLCYSFSMCNGAWQ